MQKYIILPFLFFLVSVISFAQNIDNYFEKQKVGPFQKLYLHTDREFYFEGDTLWFAAYLLDGKSQKFEFESCNLYADLINTDGEILTDELFILQNGFCSGYVPLSDTSIMEGNYLLLAYTDYLKNFGEDAFFTKTVQISSVKSSFDLTLEKQIQDSVVNSSTNKQHTNSIENRIDVSFLPEGGFLLAEESNCVAFKAINESGKGIDISGKLLDENGDLVLTFKSIYKGAGKFYFYPKAGKTYTAKINVIPDFSFQLPEIRESGAKIKLVTQEKKKLQMVVHSKNDNRNLPYQLVCLYREAEELFTLEISNKQTNQFIKINSDELKSGINRFVLLDKKMNPVSERLVFKKDVEISKLKVQLNDEAFSTREEVQINLKSDNKYRNELAQVSISVVDENYVNASGVSQNIASYLLLDSELKGHIDSPAEYFVSEDSLNSQTKLDLLMTTNGWRNYIWNLLKKDSLKIEFRPKLGFNFEGQVKRTFGKKVLTEGNVSMVIFKSDSTTQFFDQALDLNGRFDFRNVVFYDSASVFAQARNKKDKHNIQFEMNLPEINPPEINSQNLNQLQNFSEIPFSLHRQRYLNEMRFKEFYPDRNNILIKEVEVKAKKPRPKFKTGTPWKNDGPYQLTWKMTAGSFDIIEYLAYHVPGIISYRNRDNELMIKVQGGIDMGSPGFFLDGYSYFSINEIKNFNISDFSTIEIITPPMSYAYGARGIYGAVVLTFRKGDEIDSTRPLIGGIVERINGFSSLREFYSPKYSAKNINTEAPDYRNTLYWNPKVTIGSGEKEVFFFTCDNISRYKIFVEGITESGRICLGEGKFEVNSFNE
ncbi:MAG: hypothetical protein HQ522_12270 [Bacteroidetes bacterium]|nr:hypothetical protein [Bacteroidota bacterium]